VAALVLKALAGPGELSTRKQESHMAHITRSIEINRPPQEVFDALTDLRRLPSWSTIVVETRNVSKGPLQQGDTFQQTVRVAGIHLESDWRVTKLDRPHQLAYEATAVGGGRLVMTQTVTAVTEGSRLEIDVDYQLPGGILGDLLDQAYVERRNEREAEHSLHNLKDLLERRTTG
jgi:uncharacterized protein YndB with AHSA1/START domain